MKHISLLGFLTFLLIMASHGLDICLVGNRGISTFSQVVFAEYYKFYDRYSDEHTIYIMYTDSTPSGGPNITATYEICRNLSVDLIITVQSFADPRMVASAVANSTIKYFLARASARFDYTPASPNFLPGNINYGYIIEELVHYVHGMAAAMKTPTDPVTGKKHMGMILPVLGPQFIQATNAFLLGCKTIFEHCQITTANTVNSAGFGQFFPDFDYQVVDMLLANDTRILYVKHQKVDWQIQSRIKEINQNQTVPIRVGENQFSKRMNQTVRANLTTDPIVLSWIDFDLQGVFDVVLRQYKNGKLTNRTLIYNSIFNNKPAIELGLNKQQFTKAQRDLLYDTMERLLSGELDIF